MSETHDLAAVETLLEERDAVAAWLARLDEQGGAVPESVRDRVRRDYRDRLDALTDRLRQHADTVASRLAADRSEHDGLMAKARASREALAEVELRHGVGEYDDKRFESERRRHVADLESVEESLGAASDRIARLEEVHELVSGRGSATPPAAPSQPPATAPAGPTDRADEAPATAEATEPEPIEIGELAPGDDDDAEELLSIFDRAELAGEDEADDQPTEAPKAETPGFGALSFTPTGAEPIRPAVPPSTPPLGMPGHEQPPRFVRPRDSAGPRRAPEREEGPEAVRVMHDPAPILPDAPAEPSGETIARTLRCGECGAMNRPLEWYCEKCGAELSAV